MVGIWNSNLNTNMNPYYQNRFIWFNYYYWIKILQACSIGEMSLQWDKWQQKTLQMIVVDHTSWFSLRIFQSVTRQDLTISFTCI